MAAVGIVLADVRVGRAEAFATVGLGRVIVAPAHRGRGHARTVVQAALEHGRAMGPARALLFCRDAVAGLYRGLGFEEVPRPVRVRQPAGTAVMSQPTVWRPLREGAAWPAGEVLVERLPF